MGLLLSDQLRMQLHQLFPEAKDCANNTEVSINCPMCNREGNIDTHHHMYISLGLDNKPPMFNCFRNINHRGLLTQDFLEQYCTNHNIDEELFKSIQENNKRLITASSRYIKTYNTFNIHPIIPQDNDISRAKLDYINRRLGLSLDYRELYNKKIILNLYDFLNGNGIKTLTRTQYITDVLNFYYMGFLSNDNSTLIMRNLCNDKNKLPPQLQKRYAKYTIVPNDNINYYIIPTICDISKRIYVHIAEGQFDILSVYYNLRDMNNNNQLYISIGGNSYITAIQYVLSSLGIIDCEFHIYIDNDIQQDTIDKISMIGRPLSLDIYIHSNMMNNEKDFGVDKKRINEYIRHLV